MLYCSFTALFQIINYRSGWITVTDATNHTRPKCKESGSWFLQGIAKFMCHRKLMATCHVMQGTPDVLKGNPQTHPNAHCKMS